jgi:MHS family proline/betaine transporter-like MFS transporter
LLRRAVLAASAGNVVEFYDNIAFGLLAATVGRVFFPSDVPGVSLLSAFAAFAVTFLARPFGGMLFGSIGDRLGRQRSLVIVITLMSVATFAIGVLPGYATIGVAAPVVLIVLRILQGLSFGGELGGAASFVAEYAPSGRRGYLVAWVMVAAFVGNILALGVVASLSATLPEADMQAWGWRIPFLIAGPLGGLGLYIRMRLDDTPDFKALQHDGEITRSPLRRTLLGRPRQVLMAAGLSIAVLLTVYLMEAYNTNYLIQTVGMDPAGAQASTLVATFVAMVVTVLSGLASDRCGRRPVLLAASLGTAALAYPVYLIISTGDVAGAIAGQGLLGVLRGALTGVVYIALLEFFPTAIRFTGFALGYGITAALFGGTAPLVATYLVGVTGNPFSPAFYLIAAALVAFVVALASTETARTPLREIR